MGLRPFVDGHDEPIHSEHEETSKKNAVSRHVSASPRPSSGESICLIFNTRIQICFFGWLVGGSLILPGRVIKVMTEKMAPVHA